MHCIYCGHKQLMYWMFIHDFQEVECSFYFCFCFYFSIISGLQALLVSLLSFRTLIVCSDILYERDPVIEQYVVFMAFYFTYDIIVMYKGFVEKCKEKEKSSEKRINIVDNVILFCKSEFIMIIHHGILQCVGLPILLVSIISSLYFFSRR